MAAKAQDPKKTTNLSPLYLEAEIHTALAAIEEGAPAKFARATLRGLLRDLKPEIDRVNAAIDADSSEDGEE
jgi:hypothetical protein